MARIKGTRPAAAVWCSLIAVSAGGAARAETLADALALAYQSNPTLQQARAQQRALDETYVQARAGWGPTLNVTAADNYERVFDAPGTISVNSGGLTLTASQPIYTGGRTASAVQAAEASILAGRQTLRATEASVLQSVIQGYEDVLRDQTLLAIRDDDVRSLSRFQDEIMAKRTVGQITRTDLVQIQAQVAAAQAAQAAAQAQLQISRAEYTAAVGQNPGTLLAPPPLPQLPASVDLAFDMAEKESPVLLQAVLTEQSSRAHIEEARSAYKPTVAAGASIGYLGSNQPAQIVDYSRAMTAQITVTQPLFAGGANGSLVRQAIEQNTSDRIGVERARRQVVLGVSQAWNTVISTERMLKADQAELDAAQLTLEGMQAEYRLALRSTLEVLNADETVRAAQVSIANASHDAYVAESNLLGGVGRLEIHYLVADASEYDPRRNLNRVKNKGATPYEPFIASLDSLGAQRISAVKPVAAPPVSTTPVINPGAVPSADAPLATAFPTRAEPMTASPSTPASLGADTGASASHPSPQAEDEVRRALEAETQNPR